jgi:two-component system cell cycle response regulator
MRSGNGKLLFVLERVEGAEGKDPWSPATPGAGAAPHRRHTNHYGASPAAGAEGAARDISETDLAGLEVPGVPGEAIGSTLAMPCAVNTITTDMNRSDAHFEALKVLVVDDDQDSRESLEGVVRRLGHLCSSACDGVEAWEMYEADRADVILSDWRMPRLDGVGLCQKVRGDAPDGSYTHFIFVTANNDKAHFIHGMRAGADDYLAKPFDVDELEARLDAARRVALVNRELSERNSSLRHDSVRANLAARTDPLTDAFNRLALGEDLEMLAARAARYGHTYCAALCDIDNFKAYNDEFGHVPGDGVLARIAASIHGELRRGDRFYRYGGEEFLVILPEQTLPEAGFAMNRVRQAVANLQIPHATAAGSPFVTISIGVSILAATPAESIDSWIRRTDAALYAAKALGRNRVAGAG